MSPTHNQITEDTTIHGDITSASAMTIAGVIEGNVTAAGEVHVLEDALVKGDVSGPDVHVGGRVEGRVSASGKLTITRSGQVIGDIQVRALLIEEGGTLHGICKMGEQTGKHAVAASATPTPSASNGRAAPPPPPSHAPRAKAY